MTEVLQCSTEQKLLVEALKLKVTRLQATVAEKGAAAKGSYPRRNDLFRSFETAKRDLQAAIIELRAAKTVLVELSGTTGSDPKWVLLREAWHVLSSLEEQGVDIGERGQALIDDIEFHVPLAKLHEHISTEPTQANGGDK